MLTARMVRIHIIALTSMFLPLLDLEFLFSFIIDFAFQML